jgi:hypothetical protein
MGEGGSMSVEARRASRQVIEVSGLTAPRAQASVALLSGAWMVQGDIARLFEGARTALGPLLPNDPEYNVRKILDGFDPRRGHRSGQLQSVMYDVQAFRISAIRGGRAKITFSDNAIEGAVEYAEYFIAAKVRGGKLMVPTAGMVQQLQGFLRGRLPEAERLGALEAVGADDAVSIAGDAVRRVLRRLGTGVRAA